jgi:hypothetical protein
MVYTIICQLIEFEGFLCNRVWSEFWAVEWEKLFYQFKVENRNVRVVSKHKSDRLNITITRLKHQIC